IQIPEKIPEGVFPPLSPSIPLVPVGKTTDGLTRWTCIDSTLKVDLEYEPENGGRQPVHAEYIDANNSKICFRSS
ncbi:hypothetical protein PENTCL1PPCAC_3388, partial [Pristionchus entomophagus]